MVLMRTLDVNPDPPTGQDSESHSPALPGLQWIRGMGNWQPFSGNEGWGEGAGGRRSGPIDRATRRAPPHFRMGRRLPGGRVWNHRRDSAWEHTPPGGRALLSSLGWSCCAHLSYEVDWLHKGVPAGPVPCEVGEFTHLEEKHQRV